MTKVVQIVSSFDVYNKRLQNALVNCNSFNECYENVCLDVGEITKECEEKYHFKEYSLQSTPQKFVFRILFNSYMIRNYSYLKGSIANIHYVDWFYVLLLPYLKKTFTRIVICFWGDDLLRVGRLKLMELRILFNHVDRIALLTDEMVNVFRQKIGYKYDDKIRVVRFGNPLLDQIDDVSDADLMSFAQKYKIDLERKRVVVGYCRGEEQRHLEVIESIIKANVDKSRIQIIIPWTYGRENSEYKSRIIDLLDNRYDYLFLEKFIPDEEVAALRRLSDVIIQVQLTDVMSASMYETLYAGGEVITGSWLPYNDIYDRGVTMHRINDVEEVGRELLDFLDKPFSQDLLEKNKVVIGMLYKWTANVSGWVALYSDFN